MTTKEATAVAAPVRKEIKQEVINIAAAIEKDITIDAKTGVATASPDLYARLLPEGLTPAIIKDLNDHNALFAAAATLALGDKAIPVMKKHKDLDRISLSIASVGKDGFGVNFDRSRQVPDRGADGAHGTKTKYGSASVEYVMYGTKSRGELLKVKAKLADDALAAFGS